MSAPDIQDGERLGRRVSEREPRQSKRIRRNIELGADKKFVIPFQVFKPREGEAELSVDRADMVPVGQVAAVAERDAGNDGRIFHGWAVVSCARAPSGRERASVPH